MGQTPSDPLSPSYRVAGTTKPFVDSNGKGRNALIALVGAIFSLSVFFCCGGGWLIFDLGKEVVLDDILVQLNEHPIVQKETGGLDSVSLNVTGSMKQNDENTLVLYGYGKRANCELTVRSIPNEQGIEVIQKATLRMDDGRFFVLDF